MPISFLAPPVDRRVRSVLWLLFAVILVRNAWLCEDAYITFRVCDNWTHGYGMRWNALERVQVYTHPLWMLAVSAVHWVAGDVYFAGITVSFVCSGVAAWLLLSRGMISTGQSILAAALIAFSKAFVDYSTSGLENPMSHLLLILFFTEYLKTADKRSFGKMLRWASLAMFTRMDLSWLVLPAIVHMALVGGYWRRPQWRVWLSFWPFVAWEVFSLLYYGFPFPNSAYAKLGVHVPARDLIVQGLSYLLTSLSWDPLTLLTTAAMVGFGFSRWRRAGEREPALVSLGVLLYVAYVVRVGGDYMTGRFLTTPFIASVVVLSRVELESLPQFCTALGVVLAIGIASPRPPILMREEYVSLAQSPQIIDDERGYRHLDTSFLRLHRGGDMSKITGWIGDGVKARVDREPVVVYRNIGYFGFFAGPGVHVIDPYGIGDALMARIRFEAPEWVPGHFYRIVPDGYLDAALDRGEIKDSATELYWKKLELVTRGPIFSPARLWMVIRFNIGLEPFP